MSTEFEEFKGNPIIILKKDQNDTYPFRFGVRKAKLILDNIDEIIKFVEGKKVKTSASKDKDKNNFYSTPKIKFHSRHKERWLLINIL